MKGFSNNRWLLTGLVSLFLIAGLWSAVSTLGPTADPWEPHVTAAVGAYDRGDRAEGERRLRAAVAAVDRSPGQRPSLAAALDGWAARGGVDPTLVEELRETASGLRQDRPGPHEPGGTASPDLLDQLLLLYADGLFRVAGHYLRGGMVAEAEPLLKRVLFIRERLLGPQHPDAARAFDAYAEALASTNRRAQPD